VLGRLDLPDDAFQPFNPNDEAKARVLRESAFCAAHPAWQQEVEVMVSNLYGFIESVIWPIAIRFAYPTRLSDHLTRTPTCHVHAHQAQEHLKCELEVLNLLPTATGRRDALAQFVQRALLQGDYV